MRKRVLLVSIIYIIFIGLTFATPLFTVEVSAEAGSEIPNMYEDPEAYRAYCKEQEDLMWKKILEDHNKKGGFVSDYTPSTKQIIIFVVIVGVIGGVIIFIGVCIARYRMKSGDPDTVKKVKIIWTKIEYYTHCPNCGAPRMPDRSNCEYCGVSMIKSEQKMEKDEIRRVKKQLKKEGLWDKLNTDGICQLGGIANVFIKIKPSVVYMPRISVLGTIFSILDNFDCAGGGGCACACACAGGGRAGCSTKDFYNTGLKLRQLEMKKKAKTSK